MTEYFCYGIIKVMNNTKGCNKMYIVLFTHGYELIRMTQFETVQQAERFAARMRTFDNRIGIKVINMERSGLYQDRDEWYTQKGY